MDVFLTGGTGFVGRALQQELLANGHRVRLLLRPGSQFGAPRADGVTPCAADLFSPAELSAAVHGADAVIHLIGIISEIGSQTFERVHVEMTHRLVSAAQEAGVPRIVHMSALGTRPGARARYHQTKWTAEQQVRQSDLAWTIFRPSLIYGAGDAFTNLFARISAFSPVIPVMGPGTHLLQPVGVDQVARAFAGALICPEATRQTYDLCGAERLPFNDVLRAILRATGRRRFLVHLPWSVARCQAAVLESIYPNVLRRASPLNRDQLLMLQEDNVGDGSPADRQFGLHHEPFRDGIRRYLARRQTSPARPDELRRDRRATDC